MAAETENGTEMSQKLSDVANSDELGSGTDSESGIQVLVKNDGDTDDEKKEPVQRPAGHQPRESVAEKARKRGGKEFERKVKKMIRKFEMAERRIADSAEGADGFDIFQITAFLAKHTTFLSPELTDKLKASASILRGKRPSSAGGNANGHATQESDGPGHGYQESDSDFDSEMYDAGMIMKQVTTALDDEKNQDARKSVRMRRLDDLTRKVSKKNRVLKRHYWWAIFKSAFVATVQIVSLFAICWEVIGDHIGSWTDICPHASPSFDTVPQGMLKYMSCGFTLFIGMNVLYAMKALRNQGFYAALTYSGENLLPQLADTAWLLGGQTVNMIVLFGTIWTSFIVIFISENVLDMVMNSVALYFILELDDLVIGLSDYKQVERYLKHFDFDNERRADEWVRKEMDALEEHEKEDHKAHQRTFNPVHAIFGAVNWFITVAIMTPVMYLTAFMSFFVVPVYMVWCKS